MSLPRPWKAAVWCPVPGGSPVDVRRGSFRTAWDAQQWLKKQTAPGLIRQCWHETQLPTEAIAPATRRSQPTEVVSAEQGERLKAEGMAAAAANTRRDWADKCDAGIEQLARTGRAFQAADLLAIGVPEPEHPNQWGPRLGAARARGVIVPAGYTESTRATVKRSATRVWIGATALTSQVAS